MNSFSLSLDDSELQVLGPKKEAGALPALFYFALSAEESLELDPFNQPVLALPQDLPFRVFSMTIPGHEKGRDKTKAITYWAEELEAGKDLITPFITSINQAIDTLKATGWIKKESPIATMGLSRGAFIATHLAASNPQVSLVLGFSPLTKLSYQQDFEKVELTLLIKGLDLIKQTRQLQKTTLRFYIGNHDSRVGTKNCFDFVEALTQEQLSNKVRSPQVELTIFPSIGHKGHGTPPEVFRAGAEWVSAKLNEVTA